MHVLHVNFIYKKYISKLTYLQKKHNLQFNLFIQQNNNE